MSAGCVIGFLVFFVIVVGLAAIGESEGAAADVSFGFVNVLKLFGVGIVAAATMVIPGVSGSMMLMIMGYYETIIETINDFVKAMLAFDIDAMIAAMGVLVPFGVGAVLGIFAIAKLVEIVFEKAPLIAYWSIIGLIVSSPIGIVLMNKTVFVEGLNPISIITGLVALLAGGLVALKLGGE